jgi:hypothetical protein
MTISCGNARRQSTAFVDGRLRTREHMRVAAHLAGCGECTSRFEQLAVIRSVLNGMSAPAIPSRLQTDLKIIASRERASVIESKGSRLQAIWTQWKFRLSEMMRPLALPATGGLLSAALIFGTFVFMMGTTTRIESYEIPLCGDRAPNLVPVDLRSKLIVLSMTLDGNGRTADYALSEPPNRFTPDLQSHLGSITIPDMPTVFAMEQPISGDIQIRLIPLGFRQ